MARSIQTEQLVAWEGGEGRPSDIYALTCFQISRTVSQLLEVCPDFQFRPEDLVGYCFLNFGIAPDFVLEALGIADSAHSPYVGLPQAEAFRRNADKLKAASTRDALVEQIMMRAPRSDTPSSTLVDSEITDVFERHEGRDAHGRRTEILRPRSGEGIEVFYQRRVSTEAGRFVGYRDRTVRDVAVHTDILRVEGETALAGSLVVATSTVGRYLNDVCIDSLNFLAPPLP